MPNNFYNKDLLEYSRELRKSSVSKAERYLWKVILSRKQTGFGFKRQRAIDNFIVDFFCSDLKLIIEIDGSSHLNKGAYDQYRQEKLQSLGYTIIRFSEGDVLNRYAEIESMLIRTIEVLKEKERD